jgi:hypothetical protein
MAAPTGPFSEYAPTVATIKPGSVFRAGQARRNPSDKDAPAASLNHGEQMWPKARRRGPPIHQHEGRGASVVIHRAEVGTFVPHTVPAQ